MATIRKKRNNYQCMVRRAGYSVQSKTFRTRRLAEQWGRDVESKIDQGVFQDRSKAKTMTLDDVMNQYLIGDIEKRRSQNSRESYRYAITRFLRVERELCALSMDKLTVQHIEAFRDRRLNQASPMTKKGAHKTPTLAESTVVREIGMIKKAIDYCKNDLRLHDNPASGTNVKRPTINDEREVCLSRDQKSALLKACYKRENLFIGPCIDMLFETGARRGEMLGLKWADVNLDKGTAIFRDVKNTRNPKKITNRAIGLTPKAKEIVMKLPMNQDALFPISANCLSLSYRRARSEAGLPNFRIHDIRHYFATKLIEAGWSPLEVMEQLGHKDMRSLKRYAHVRAIHLADKLATL